jgi:hypothetical protein
MTEATRRVPVALNPLRMGVCLVVLALVVVACSATPSDGPVALRTAQVGPVCEAARLSGILVADPTFGLAFKRDGGVQGVVWPTGYGARRESGVVVLIDPAGQVVAREGDYVVAAGAEGADGLDHPCSDIHVEPQPST